jgi:drug/metabolite transporter (DMT)-like permease
MHTSDNPNTMYRRFAIMIALSFILMFGFMYAMVDRLGNAYPNLNQAYMAGLMVAPMAILELFLMGQMYPRKKWNGVIIAAGALLLVACWFGIREQVAITDKSFLRSMIPHHAGAVLMCNQAPITDAEIRGLCARIEKSQQQEIDQMKNILHRLN